MAGSRPLTSTLLREASIVRLFLQLLAEESISCCFGNVKDFAGCLRLAQNSAPPQFCPYGLCEKSSHYVMEDLASPVRIRNNCSSPRRFLTRMSQPFLYRSLFYSFYSSYAAKKAMKLSKTRARLAESSLFVRDMGGRE